jgi:hypothetical protein
VMPPSHSSSSRTQSARVNLIAPTSY